MNFHTINAFHLISERQTLYHTTLHIVFSPAISLLDHFHPQPRNPLSQQTLDDLSSEEDEQPQPHKFQYEMLKHDIGIYTLMENSTHFSQPVDRNFCVRSKKVVKKQFRDLIDKQHAALERNGRVHKITVPH